MRSPVGESFSAPNDVDLDGAAEAYRRACELAEELGDVAAHAAAIRELGVISIAAVRQWYMERVESGEVVQLMARVTAGETPEEILADTPVASEYAEGVRRYERAVELFEQVGDRRGVMSSIIARAYVNFAIDLHMLGAANRIEEIRRLTAQMTSLTRESERATVEAKMVSPSRPRASRLASSPRESAQIGHDLQPARRPARRRPSSPRPSHARSRA